MIELINHIQDKDDFINFLKKLSLDYKEHNEEWENPSVSEFLEQIASWIEDYSESPANDIEWDKPGYQMFAKLLYMGKIYE